MVGLSLGVALAIAWLATSGYPGYRPTGVEIDSGADPRSVFLHTGDTILVTDRQRYRAFVCELQERSPFATLRLHEYGFSSTGPTSAGTCTWSETGKSTPGIPIRASINGFEFEWSYVEPGKGTFASRDPSWFLQVTRDSPDVIDPRDPRRLYYDLRGECWSPPPR
jgi:hypothetical protein